MRERGKGRERKGERDRKKEQSGYIETWIVDWPIHCLLGVARISYTAKSKDLGGVGTNKRKSLCHKVLFRGLRVSLDCFYRKRDALKRNGVCVCVWGGGGGTNKIMK